MAVLSGKKGIVKYKGGSVAGLRNWSLNVNTNMLDVTVQSTSGVQWRAMLPGLSGADGTFAGLWDSASTGQRTVLTNVLTPATGTLTLYTDDSGGDYFSASAYFSAFSVNADIDATVDSNYSFTVTGAVTFTTG